jgi:cell wall-associated NlpC family hydrolase
VSSHTTGRHRAPNRLSASSNLSSALSRTAKPASKASAVIVISGAMVASLALPATAATPVAKVPVAAPFALAVAVAAPSAAQAPLVPRSFGNIGFKGVVKPKLKPKPKPKPKLTLTPVAVPRALIAVSRSTTRVAISLTATSTATSSAAPATSASVAPESTGGALGIAASLAGIYYVWGGTTTAGFDCSGFTQYVFNQLGISIPRTAAEQQAALTPVSDPQPGDLVFFGTPAYHVGIYAGNGMMWDSPHTGAAIALRAVWSSSPTYGRP